MGKKVFSVVVTLLLVASSSFPRKVCNRTGWARDSFQFYRCR